MIEMHYPAKGDLPEPSDEMRAQRKKVLAYTKSLGWTQAVRRQVGKRKFEWVCSDYDGNTLFSDDEITAWTELPEPEQEGFGLNGLCKIAHKIEQCVNTVTMLATCSAEVVETSKAYVKYVTERTNETKRHFASELADTVICCMIIAEQEGVDLENALVDCIEKNRKRAEGVGDKK